MDETTKKVMQIMVKVGKLSQKGNTVSYGKCGRYGHNKRAFNGPKEKQVSGKGKKATIKECVADVEASELSGRKIRPMDSQATEDGGSQRKNKARRA